MVKAATITLKNVSCHYRGNTALKNTSLEVPPNSIYAFIGPSGCGKTTLLRSINRMNDLIPGFRLDGRIEIDGENIYADSSKKYVEDLRRRIGIIFQQPNPLPTSILKNMYLPLREHYVFDNDHFQQKAIANLQEAAIYDEVKDRLDKSALSLSGGQRQRLCIARAMMLDPKIMLFDEPCSAIDPVATLKIEDLLNDLKKDRTIIIVTHNMEQAKRIADYVAFFYKGEMVEAGKAMDIFTRPQTEILHNYITGRF
ncbi:MAG: phosphate ABC transporter ATP-binding protein [Clostridiales bacterium]|jgi:phosphate transport system ATP-binding protein|nr:phosphate ABC transporter ATP-binding protein [Clostridiales bacterium]